MAATKYKTPRYCAYCGRFFYGKTISTVYCSKECSRNAYNEKVKLEKLEIRRLKRIDELKRSGQEFISITNAVAIFEVSRSSVRRCVISGKASSMRIGKKKLLVRWKDLEAYYSVRPVPIEKKAKLFNLEPDKCYTIGEITEQFGVSQKTVYCHIRAYAIPIRQIGKYVYAPKEEIDNLYKKLK